MNKIKVLLVEDENVLASIIKEALETRDFLITIAGNGVEGWTLFHQVKPDLCVIDVMMPRKDGFSLVQDIRKIDGQVPIIFLTAKTQTEDVLKGFELGADDYMKKPFSMEELVFRLKSLIRRKLPEATKEHIAAQKITTIGTYHFTYSRLELTHDLKTAYLSQREAELLDLLLQHKNELLDRRSALLKIWNDDNIFNARSMDVYITRLRKYFCADPNVEIQNVRGLGYRLIEHLH
jgi:two-component system, OmpR family, response regulator TrcR